MTYERGMNVEAPRMAGAIRLTAEQKVEIAAEFLLFEEKEAPGRISRSSVPTLFRALGQAASNARVKEIDDFIAKAKEESAKPGEAAGGASTGLGMPPVAPAAAAATPPVNDFVDFSLFLRLVDEFYRPPPSEEMVAEALAFVAAHHGSSLSRPVPWAAVDAALRHGPDALTAAELGALAECRRRFPQGVDFAAAAFAPPPGGP